MKTQPSFPALLQAFFTDRLMSQRNASPHTIASYRDTFRLLLEFAQRHLHKSPSTLAVENLDAPFIGRFLTHLERERDNTPRSRNIRLAAIHSFFKYVALEEPALSGLAQRILAIPCKRHKTRSIDFFDASRNRCPLGSTRPKLLFGTSRPDAVVGCRTDGAARFGVDWAALPGRVPGQRCPRSMCRQRTQGAVHTIEKGRRRGPAGLDTRTKWPTFRCALSECPRSAT